MKKRVGTNKSSSTFTASTGVTANGDGDDGTPIMMNEKELEF